MYQCVCPEGFTGENCQTPDISTATPRQQSGEEEKSAIPAAIIAAIVTGLLVVLLCAVVVTIIIVCIWLRKRSTKRESN